MNWEARIRPFEPAPQTNAVSDLRVLQILADELGIDLGFKTAADARRELDSLEAWVDREPRLIPGRRRPP